MTWARLDDKLHSNPKIGVAWACNPASVGLHVLAISYAAGQETNGFVPVAFVREKTQGARVLRTAPDVLVAAGLWRSVDGGWTIHDFLDFNPSREEIAARRRRDADRKARERVTRGRPALKDDAESPRGHGADVHADTDGTSARTGSGRPYGLTAESSRARPQTRPDPTLIKDFPLTPKGGNPEDDSGEGKSDSDRDAIGAEPLNPEPRSGHGQSSRPDPPPVAMLDPNGPLPKPPDSARKRWQREWEEQCAAWMTANGFEGLPRALTHCARRLELWRAATGPEAAAWARSTIAERPATFNAVRINHGENDA